MRNSRLFQERNLSESITGAAAIAQKSRGRSERLYKRVDPSLFLSVRRGAKEGVELVRESSRGMIESYITRGIHNAFRPG